MQLNGKALGWLALIHMETGIQLTVEWLDDNLVGLRIRASNGSFSGVADVVVAADFARHLAETVVGFPRAAADRRSAELGTFDPEYAGGGVRLDFHTIDGAGHAVVDVVLRTDPHAGSPETAAFVIPLEAARIDEFIAQLGGMSLEPGAGARLVAA